MGRRALAAALVLLLAAGCSPFPLSERPLVPAVDLDLREARANVPRWHVSYEGLIYAVCPLIPYYSVDAATNMGSSFLPEIRDAARASGLFESVTANGDDPEKRAAALYVLRVTLRDSSSARAATTYLLGFPAFLLYVFGVPVEYGSAHADVQVDLLDREGRVVASGHAEDRDHGFRVIYEDTDAWERGHLRTALEEALARALEGCRPGLSAVGAGSGR